MGIIKVNIEYANLGMFATILIANSVNSELFQTKSQPINPKIIGVAHNNLISKKCRE